MSDYFSAKTLRKTLDLYVLIENLTQFQTKEIHNDYYTLHFNCDIKGSWRSINPTLMYYTAERYPTLIVIGEIWENEYDC